MTNYYFSDQSQNTATLTGGAIFYGSSVNNGSIFIPNGDWSLVVYFNIGTINNGDIYVNHGGQDDGDPSVYFYGTNYGNISSYGDIRAEFSVWFTPSSVNNGAVYGNAQFYQATNNGTVSGYASLDSGSVNTGTLLSAFLAEGVTNTGTVVVIVTGGGVQYTAISANNTVYYVSGANMTLDAAASASAVLYTDVGLSNPGGPQTGITTFQHYSDLYSDYRIYAINSNGVVSLNFSGYNGQYYYINGEQTNLDANGSSEVRNDPPAPFGQGNYIGTWNGLVYEGGSPFSGTISLNNWEAIYDPYGNITTYGYYTTTQYNYLNGVLLPY